MKAQIDHITLKKLMNSIPLEKHKPLKDAVEAMNDMVNHIEHSNRTKTTQDYYGDYLQLIKTKQDFVLYRIAGAGPGAISAARINLGL